MAIVYDGALTFGQTDDLTSDTDATRHLSHVLGSTVDADWADFLFFRVGLTYAGADPTQSNSSPFFYRQNFAPPGVGSGGSDCYDQLYPKNGSVTARRGRFTIRWVQANANLLAAGGTIQCQTVWKQGDIGLRIIQRRGENIEVKIVKPSSAPGGAVAADVVTEFTGARNTGFGARAMGTVRYMAGTPGSIQAAGFVQKSFTDAEIASMINGADLETLVPSGARQHLSLFNSKAASIPATWGTATLTQNGFGWEKIALRSPLTPNASDAITVTSGAPRPYGVIGVPLTDTLGVAAGDPVVQLSGTYAGATPLAMRVRHPDLSGTTDLLAWTSLSNFTASGGAWSGQYQPAKTGGTRRMEVQVTETPSRTWKGGNAFNIAGAVQSAGQSPMAQLEHGSVQRGWQIPAGTPHAYVLLGGVDEIFIMNAAIVTGGAIQTALDFNANTGLALLWLMTAVSGSSSKAWANKSDGSTFATPNSDNELNTYPQFIAATRLIASTCKHLLVFWQNGAADAGGTLTAANIYANHDAIVEYVRQDYEAALGGSFLYVMLPFNRDTGVSGNDKVRGAQLGWANDRSTSTSPNYNSHVRIGASWPDMVIDQESNGSITGSTTTTCTLDNNDQTAIAVVGGATPTLPTARTLRIVSGKGQGQEYNGLISGGMPRTFTLDNGATWADQPDTTSKYTITGGVSPHPSWKGIRIFANRLAQTFTGRFGYSPNAGRGPSIIGAEYPPGTDGSIIDTYYLHRSGNALRTPNGSSYHGGGRYTLNGDSGAPTWTNTMGTITGAAKTRIVLPAPVAPANRSKVRIDYDMDAPVLSHDAFNHASATVAPGIFDGLYDNSGVGPNDLIDIPAINGLPVENTPTGGITPIDNTAATATIHIGGADVTALKVGANAVSAAYVGTTKVL
jgi:hypothetical protein